MKIKERELIIQALRSGGFKQLLNEEITLASKCSEKSANYRKLGNALYTKKDHDSKIHEDTWKLYTKSVATAPINSESLALAYGNRSALLYHLKKFGEANDDIDRALLLPISEILKEKLLVRKEKCLELMENNENDEENDLKDILNVKTNSLIDIKFNPKYGRHLVANRKINPGEIVMTAKPFATFVNLKTGYAFCHHCLRLSWSSIPCDKCTWCMFCSENCKKEAWDSYHDIECSLMQFVICSDISDYAQRLCVKILLIAMKEYNGIENLKKEVDCIDNWKNPRTKGFSGSGEFQNNFKSIYSLSKNISQDVLRFQVFNALSIIVGLTKYTYLFKDISRSKNPNDFLNSEDVIFMAILILKLLGILQTNSHNVRYKKTCRYGKNLEICVKTSCCDRGCAIIPQASLVNHSCDPNVSRIFSEDSNLIIYAIKPIKRNAQIFDSYFHTFYQQPNPERSQQLKHNFNFDCDCLPCRENWPITLPTKEIKNNRVAMLVENIFHEQLEALKAVENGNIYNCNISKQQLKSLGNAISKLNQNFKQPDFNTYRLIDFMNEVLELKFGIQQLKVPNAC